MRVLRDDRPVAAGIKVRSASERDGDEIASLFRRVPAADPSGFTWFDHGDAWWNAVGSRPGRHVFVAEREDAIVGVHSVTVHAARLDRRPIRLALLGPTRIDPSVQGTGVFGALRSAVTELADREAAELYALIPVGDPPRRLPLSLRRWPVRVHRTAVDCRGAAADSSDARRTDVTTAARLIAGMREAAALAPADDLPALCERVVGEGGYGLDRLLTNGDAVLGVSRWVALVRDDHRARPRRQVTAWDIGATSPIALESLVRAWCARLAGDGVDDLVLWSCAGDLIDRAAVPLARSTTAHVVDLGLTPPPHTASRGIHLDLALL